MHSYLQPLIDPTSIAVLGASANPARLGGVPISLLREHGFAGRIYPINPKYPEIDGLPCYPDIASLPAAVDLLVVAVSAQEVLPALRQAAQLGIRSAVVFAAGYAETGDKAGRQLQEELVAFSRETGLLVAGPNCMGFGNLDNHAYSTFTLIFRSVAPPPAPRDVALVTQSGSVCAAVYAAGRQLGVKFNVVLNTGNEACVEFSEYLGYLAERPGTEAIVGYVEGLRDGGRFAQVAANMRDRGQLLSLLKVGDSAKGVVAAASHTAAVTGSQTVYQAMFARLCVVPARDILHLADIAYLARFRHKRSGPRVAILTISGAIGAILSDQFTSQGVEVPTFSNEIQAMLHTEIPRYGMVLNPVDLTGNIVNRQAFVAEALRMILDSDSIDFAVLFAPGYLLDRMADGILPLSRSSGKLVAAIRNGASARQSEMEDSGIPVFDDTTRAVNALSSLAAWHQQRRRYTGLPPSPAAPANPRLDALLRSIRHSDRQALNEYEAKRFLAASGLAVVDEAIAGDPATAVAAAERLGYPVVLKVLSADIAHKTEVGGVALNLADAAAVRRAFTEVSSQVGSRAPQARIDGVLIQRQFAGGLELFVSVARDPTFGLMLNVGVGGLWVEIYRDVSCAPLPVDGNEALRLLQALKAWPLLRGARGATEVDVSALVDVLVCLSDAALAVQHEIDLIEINPVLVDRDSIVAVDAIVSLTPTAAQAA